MGDEQEQRLVDDLVVDLLQDLVLRRRIERRARFSSNASIARVVLALVFDIGLIDNVPSAITSAQSSPNRCERHLVESDCHLQW